MNAPDFRSLFDVSPNAYMVLDRELRYVAANRVYLRETGSRLEDLLGRKVFELFPHDPEDPNNAPARMLLASFERVLATGKSDHLALIRYRVPREEAGQRVIEDRYWSATHSPVLDANGAVTFILQHTVDVTALQGAAPSADLATETGILSRAEAVQQANARLDAERGRLAQLFEQAPGFMCVLDGPDHVITLVNGAYLRLVGRGDVTGKPVRVALPEVVEQGFVDLLDRVRSSGEPFVGQDVRVLLADQERFVDFIFQPLRGASGAVEGVFVQGHDVTGRKIAERESQDARRAAEAFAEELASQSQEVKAALDQATARIAELEAQRGAP